MTNGHGFASARRVEAARLLPGTQSGRQPLQAIRAGRTRVRHRPRARNARPDQHRCLATAERRAREYGGTSRRATRRGGARPFASAQGAERARLMFLLDAEIVFDLRHVRADGEGAALAGWAQRTSRQSMFLSALSLVELENGAARAAKQGKAAGKAWRDCIDGQLLPAVEGRRSEEHTSELQSLMRISYAVFCLKKKTGTASVRQKLRAQRKQNRN